MAIVGTHVRLLMQEFNALTAFLSRDPDGDNGAHFFLGWSERGAGEATDDSSPVLDRWNLFPCTGTKCL